MRTLKLYLILAYFYSWYIYLSIFFIIGVILSPFTNVPLRLGRTMSERIVSDMAETIKKNGL